MADRAAQAQVIRKQTKCKFTYVKVLSRFLLRFLGTQTQKRKSTKQRSSAKTETKMTTCTTSTETMISPTTSRTRSHKTNKLRRRTSAYA